MTGIHDIQHSIDKRGKVTNPAVGRLEREKCSFQKESVVCGRRIGIRIGSRDIVYYPRHEDPSYSLSCPENKQENNNNTEYW